MNFAGAREAAKRSPKRSVQGMRGSRLQEKSMQHLLRGAQGMAMLVAALTMLGGATGMLLRGDQCPVRGVRGGDLAYASYDFTTKATGTLRTKAQEEPPL